MRNTWEVVEALALASGRVDEELLLRNEYLAAENEILKSKLNKPLQLNNLERIRLAKIGKRVGLKALREVSCIVDRRQFWNGLEGWLQRNSMAPCLEKEQDDQELIVN